MRHSVGDVAVGAGDLSGDGVFGGGDGAADGGFVANEQAAGGEEPVAIVPASVGLDWR